MKKVKGKIKQPVDDNPIEKLLGIGTGVVDEILGFSKSSGKQGENQSSGELAEGEELDLKELAKQKEEIARIEPAINYSREVVHVAEQAVNRESQEIEAQLKELMTEIKKLVDSSKELQFQFKEIAVEQHAATPGKYHKSFFSWLFSVIRAARMKVEDSNAWLAVMHSKKKSREYGAMAKKHGTTFTLNNERNVATQVG